MKIYIRKNTNYFPVVKYVLLLIEKNIKNKFYFVDQASNSDFIWDHEHPSSIPIALDFYQQLVNKDKSISENYFNTKPIVFDKDGRKDSVATIFYMVNCVQEFANSPITLDNYGRFKYLASYQFKFKNIEQNLVEEEIIDLCKLLKQKTANQRSRFFISHDIDTIYGSFFEDGFWALKRMNIGVILNLIIWELTNRPHWKNIDKIIQINNEYDIRSTFFWLVNKGKGIQNIKNADYRLLKEKKLIDLVTNSGNQFGLHKSCSEMTINEELEFGKLNTTFNRYHFLKFATHLDWEKISNSSLNFDCSLGFAEHFGFRNSYGKAFQPFDIIKMKPFDFIEAPLHFMDGTFNKYMKIPQNKIAETIIQFVEKNPNNCDFSLLWHNTYFTNFKYGGFIKEYKKLLGFIYENKLECVSPDILIKDNSLTW